MDCYILIYTLKQLQITIKQVLCKKSLNGFSFKQIVVYNLEIKYMQLTLITRNIYTYLTFHSNRFLGILENLKWL